MRIIICEDDKELCQKLTELIKCHGKHSVIIFHSGDHLWFHYFESAVPVDLILLDIEMPGNLNGIEAARKIRDQDEDVEIVILSAFPKYSLAGYEVRPYHYLLKPLDTKKMYQIMDAVSNRAKLLKDSSFNIVVSGKVVRIRYETVIYIEAKLHYANIKTVDGSFYSVHRKLSEIMKDCDARFLSPHRSYIVNADRIVSIEPAFTSLTMDDGAVIPISKIKKSNFKKELSRYDTSLLIKY